MSHGSRARAPYQKPRKEPDVETSRTWQMTLTGSMSRWAWIQACFTATPSRRTPSYWKDLSLQREPA